MVQRTSSDLRLNPHLHLIVLDGAWHEDGGELSPSPRAIVQRPYFFRIARTRSIGMASTVPLREVTVVAWRSEL